VGHVIQTGHNKLETKIIMSVMGTNSHHQTSQSGQPSPTNGAFPPAGFPIIVHSHLSWDWVWQRPQQFLSRLSQNHRVLFVELLAPSPQLVSPHAELRPAENYPNITILKMQFPLWRWADGDYVDQKRRRLVQAALRGPLKGQFNSPVQWFYDPMAVTAFAGQMEEQAVVYDCMDELSKFHGAPPEILEREAVLLDQADVVFTGGRKMHEAKVKSNANCHFFGCGVDNNHFGRARQKETIVPAELAALPKPVLGYFGVVDERLDYELIGKLADANPHGSVAIIGPVTKVDESKFPRRANLHWLGRRDYADLPACVKAFDVCLMPFAMNKSTESINPTKALEYMAAGRMIVSSAVPDVVTNFGSVVKVAKSHEEFIQLCVQCAVEPDAKTIANGVKLAGENSWEHIIGQMTRHIVDVLEKEPEAPLNRVNGNGFHKNGDGIVNGNGHSHDLAPLLLNGNGHNGEHRPTLGFPAVHTLKTFDYLIVGAGYAGSVLAERLARGAGKQVLLVDRRPHFGGNAYDHYDAAGILVHKYGPHIFHTNCKEIFDYLSRFTAWRNYQHQVRAQVDGQLVPIPINLDTINLLYGTSLNSLQVEEFLASRAEKRDPVRTSEDVVVNKVGRELYEKLFKGYTNKAWGLDPSQLDAEVTARIPTRTNRDARYFTDTYQAMPQLGFTHMFGNMLDHPNIKLFLNVDYREIKKAVRYRELIFTGPVDEYFDYRHGKLPYRCLRFEHQTLNQPNFQPVGVVNYPNEYAFTRITEFKHLTGQEHAKTSIVYEYPQATGDEYYPIPRSENTELYKKYQSLAEAATGVHFVGRLATYRYYNMDQVAAQALTVFTKICGLNRADALALSQPAKTAFGFSNNHIHANGHHVPNRILPALAAH
jgi:UDP-galactopyranose mutase